MEVKMNLLIVESPNKIKKLSSFLGPDWTVKASIGHISDLAIRKGFEGLGIEDNINFKPIYEIDADKKDVVDSLKKTASNKNVYIATDPDREGEAIASHIKHFLNLKEYKRVMFHEITEQAVKAAIANPTKIDDKLVAAQETRRIIDRIYGFKGSNVISRENSSLKSVGRVQSAGLKIVVDREREIQAFKSTKYQEPVLMIGDIEFKLNMETEQIIKTDFNKFQWPSSVAINNIEKIDENVNPPRPLTTNTALKLGAKLGFRPKETTKLLQELFEQGLVTYIRTDSCNVSDDFKAQAKKFIERQNLQADTSRTYKLGENAQEGHEAIRPTHIDDLGIDIKNASQKKLYEQIRLIALASQMISGADTKQSASVEVNGLTFTNTSKIIKKLGYREVIAPSGEYGLTNLQTGSHACKVQMKTKTTSAPSRYTETSFLTKLEKSGIGRPSTFASILQTILDRHYVTTKDTQLIPTQEGFDNIAFMNKNFAKFVAADFTSEMEKDLDLIAQNKKDKLQVLQNFNNEFNSQVTQVINLRNTNLAAKYGICPECKSPLNKREGKYGSFYGCTNYPKCKYMSKTSRRR